MEIPQLSEHEVEACLESAAASERRRHAKIFHERGDELNRIVNFLMTDTYMQPHLHPGEEKIERIQALQGIIAVIFFDNQGAVTHVDILEKDKHDYVNVPAFAWHTYVVLSETAISYETMMGVYNEATWKKMASWAPPENTPESKSYLALLKSKCLDHSTGNSISPSTT